MATTVHVKNISSKTSEKEVRDFFSFCGKITSLSVTPESSDSDSNQSAAVTFEKETAAKTALLLDNTQLGAAHVQVTAAQSLDQMAGGKTAGAGDEKADLSDIEQEDKPRSRIIAEYLAHGYTIGDTAIQRAIELDSKHGISGRFTSALANFDNRVKATDKARSLDAKVGVSDKAQAGWTGLNSYFEKALGTPTGQRVREFYLQSDKQVRDIHAEARRLADLKKQEGGSTQTSGTDKGDLNLHQVEGTNKTACDCGGETGICPCESGKCACSGCGKSTGNTSDGRTATGDAPDLAAKTEVAPLGDTVAPTQ
ncbi:MAG: hypothetical protein M1833_003947 [Piccolia ochrophora]|nr:MAG: hypothetical protein M1833_003947 [Piccolia ochrophora]